MNVLVTGGGGFIGSHVVDRLLAANHDVIVFDQVEGWHADSDATFVKGDITSVDSVADALDGVDTIFHLAAVSNVDVIAEDPASAVDINIGGTAKVLEAARLRNVPRVVLASTVWVYEAATNGVTTVNEQTPIRLDAMNHVYTATKAAAEMLMYGYHQLYGQEFTILRYGIPYGPRMRDELVIARFVQRALEGMPLTIAGDGKQQRNYIYVEDLADAHVRALRPQAANQLITLDGAKPVSVRELVDVVHELVGEVRVEQVPGRKGDFHGRQVSNERAQLLLDWKPTTTIKQGVARYLDWYLAERSPNGRRSE
jgi:UDP-glucose 4-epimerase